MKLKFPLFGLLLSTVLIAGEHVSYLPHFAIRQNEWQTQLHLINPNSVSATVVVKAYDSYGLELAEKELKLIPYGTYREQVTDLFQLPVENGWLTLTCNRQKLDGLMTFTNLVTGATSSLPLSQKADRLLTLPLAEEKADAITGWVVTNVTGETVDVTFNLVDSATGQRRQRKQTLAAGHKITGVPSDLFGEELPEQGAIQIQASGWVTGFGLNFLNNMQQIVAVPAGVHDPGSLPFLQERVDAMIQSTSIEGIASGFQIKGQDPKMVVSGLADRENQVPLNGTQPADVGSITKTFMAALFLLFEEEGLLQLEDTLAKWMPQFPKAEAIQLRMLLDHTSGVFNYTNTQSFLDDLVASLENPRVWEPQNLLDYALAEGDDGFSFEPGTQWGYSNTNYILLGMVAEQVGKANLASLLRQRFFQPLGLDDTYLDGSEPVPNRARQYNYDDSDQSYLEVSQTLHMSWSWAAGAIVSTPEDLMVFGQALFGGQLISQASLNKMITPLGPAEAENYGLGIGAQEINGQLLLGHAGRTFGGAAFFVWHPALDAVIAYQITSSSERDTDHLLTLMALNLEVLTNETVERSNLPQALFKHH